MRINGETVFRFNPFNIQEWDDKDVIEQYNLLEESLNFGDVPVEIADDIDCYANMGYLIGEMIARYYERVEVYAVKLKVTTSNDIYRERDTWIKTQHEKPPAMSYFESKTTSKYLNEYQELARLESTLKRFKFAYDSIESKQNALKKKLEATKFDLINR